MFQGSVSAGSLGAGLEYAVMKNLNVRAEALHFDLSDVSDRCWAPK